MCFSIIEVKKRKLAHFLDYLQGISILDILFILPKMNRSAITVVLLLPQNTSGNALKRFDDVWAFCV